MFTMTFEEFDSFANISDNIEIQPEYPSLEEFSKYMEETDMDQVDFRFLMWLEVNLPQPSNEEEEIVMRRLHDFLHDNVVIVNDSNQ